jgi:hypothetical protein
MLFFGDRENYFPPRVFVQNRIASRPRPAEADADLMNYFDGYNKLD